MTAPSVDWRVIAEEARPGPMQMALDEVAAETAAAGGPATVRTYRWDPSCLTLGYRQDPDTVDWAFCEREGIDVTRRQTGGGGIYHDAYGDIAYSIAVPADEVPGELLDCYHLLCEPIFDAFARLGIDAAYVDEKTPELYHPACYLRELHPAHDVVAGGTDGSGSAASDADGSRRRKIAGNAQYRKREAVIQHGSLSFSVDADRHLGTFADPPVTPEAFRNRVVGMDELTDAARDDAVSAVADALATWAGSEKAVGSDETIGGDGSVGAEGTSGSDTGRETATVDRDGSWTDAELRRAAELAGAKYRDPEWVRTRPGGDR
ncbi:lipoate--protein ligase family protein [Halorubrum laminariae]|uniref:Biotin/lipoate A/B protein ligase family protein n=1 Tax=Halorubrum laminariae TaxID=1433523 RepID=A0ABD6C0K8_9EURY|nr:biotin/lipoate A/B protein ligase family protein [Halorubrum laminariae]